MTAGNWGVMNRNTIGSPNADLRSGPSTPTLAGLSGRLTPPLGTGSLNLGVSAAQVAGTLSEKVAYGNEVDFFGQPFNVTAVGFQVYNNQENISIPPPAIANMPKIAFEIDPNRELPPFNASNFSTLTFFLARLRQVCGASTSTPRQQDSGARPGERSRELRATSTVPCARGHNSKHF